MKVKRSPVFDVIIIGAGVIGAAIARELSKSNLQVGILERNLQVGQETSSGNSGIIHGGFDPTPGSLSAKLNLLGRHSYETEWFLELNFPAQQFQNWVKNRCQKMGCANPRSTRGKARRLCPFAALAERARVNSQVL
jgi:L-2-hydroxyglutarate oxidase LhgO